MKDNNARRLVQNKREKKRNALGPGSIGKTETKKTYGGSDSPKMPGDLERDGNVSESY